jgi:hypothetical protein
MQQRRKAIGSVDRVPLALIITDRADAARCDFPPDIPHEPLGERAVAARVFVAVDGLGFAPSWSGACHRLALASRYTHEPRHICLDRNFSRSHIFIFRN